MKILCLSDLHRQTKFYDEDCDDIRQTRWIINVIEEHKPDVIVITGDIFEHTIRFNPYEELHNFFYNINSPKIVPIICTLGNHEFYYDYPQNTIRRYTKMYSPKKYNVHYLDIIDNKIIDNVNFLGNALLYDGSTATTPFQNLYDWANNCWSDRLIENFDYIKWNTYYINKIKKSIISDKINILCTHCVPHILLNAHSNSDFNAYAGVSDLLDKIKVDYAICGHTHLKDIGRIINGCKCVNIGSDYYADTLKYYMLEV